MGNLLLLRPEAGYRGGRRGRMLKERWGSKERRRGFSRRAHPFVQ
jgi:hypothetical protein